PPVKIVKAGKHIEEVWKILLANTRTPHTNYGDLRAMIGSVDLGEERVKGLIAKYGLELFEKTCDDLLDYSERRMRAEIAEYPDGVFSFEDVVENDGIVDKNYLLAVDIHIQGDEIVADYHRSSDQALGPISATLGVARGATYNGILHMTDPEIPR